MFTLEDLDLSEELEFFRAHGTDLMSAPAQDDQPTTSPEADARLHPADYFIAGH
ncbi:hypothetical protein [Austwickia chelonae]|nr:hypothetical protein [Austwickia chelonae]